MSTTKKCDEYEYCTCCDANLTLQKGYNNELPYWICKGCGEMLINPNVPGDVAWICDKCESMLNIQEGFSEDCEQWTCTQCGYINKIDKSEIYLSDDEYRAECNNPYRGLSDEDALELSMYCDMDSINQRDDIVIVRHIESEKLYVKKILSTYDAEIYEYLKLHPIHNMPKIYGIYKSENKLIIIEEYIPGATLTEYINANLINSERAVYIARQICYIAMQLHNLDKPIIHRDIKPSNIIVTKDGEIYLLDINVAKWYKEDEIEDTKLMGTRYYAAPEQLGYGFLASSEKSDIYAIGVLLNVMVTGELPKEEKAPGVIWNVVERCIRLEAVERYTDRELIDALDSILR